MSYRVSQRNISALLPFPIALHVTFAPVFHLFIPPFAHAIPTGRYRSDNLHCDVANFEFNDRNVLINFLKTLSDYSLSFAQRNIGLNTHLYKISTRFIT